jgi:hypothetical protein
MSCLWLLLSSVLHLVVVPPNVVLFVAMIEVAWDMSLFQVGVHQSEDS